MQFQEKFSYGGWNNNLRLSNGSMELVITTDVGPRIIKFAAENGKNLFKEFKDEMGKLEGSDWMSFGGHRLWHSPEVFPRTYALDFDKVNYSWDGKVLKLDQKVESITGIKKDLEISLDEKENHVKVIHKLTNKNLWAVELAAWALTVVTDNMRAIVPQEDFVLWEDDYLPSKPIVLWKYTTMDDPRWKWGSKFIQLKQDPNAKTRQKFGTLNKKGWSAGYLDGELFVKTFDYIPDATYLDFGSNNEIYTDGDLMEIESLSPIVKLEPGKTLEHTEHWFYFKTVLSENEAELDKTITPFIEKAKKLSI